MKKAEPWNNVCVSFSISKEAANRFKHLALHNDEQLKRLGILSVQVQGEETVKLSISNSRGSVQEVILGQQSSQLPASGALVSTSGFGHGNDPREFDTILNQIKAGQLHQNLTGYVASEDQTVFVVPQSTKRSNSRKVKEKGLTKSNNNNDMPSTTNVLNSAPNGPVICSTNTSNNQELLPARRDNSSQPNMTDSFGDLGDMHHLDFNDLIGADGSLSKHYNEMVTDIFHVDSSMTGPQHNPTLGLSPTSVNSNQVPSQIGGGNMNNTNLISSNPSEHNTNEVDELLDHIQSIGNEAEQSNGRLNASLDLPFNQDSNYTNASATAPALQRQMSYPQYSSKGLLHGPNTQGMFTAGVSGKHSVGQINSTVTSPLHHNMMASMGPGSDSAMHIAGNQFASGPLDKNVEAGFTDFNQSYTHCNQDMMGMHKQMISRPPSAGMIQTSGTLNTNWKMPGQHQHAQLNTMQRSPGLASPKPVNMPGSAGYNPALTPTKRSYPGLAVSQMDVQTVGDGSKVQCMSMASPLLVNLLQTSTSTTMAGSGHIINPQLPGTVGEPPRPTKKKKQTRRKKISKQGGYNSTTPDQSMIPSPGVMQGQMTTHMSPQHGGARMQQTHFNTQYVMQPVNSPGQYFHPAQSPMPQIRGSIPEGQKGAAMFSHYPNGTNITPPGLRPMGKASPGHLFGSDQKTAFIETINRSDVGSRIANNTPMVQQRVPTPGHSPSAHGHITPNHMPSSSVGAGGAMFMGNITGTVHHGPRMQAMNGMQHPQMQNRMQPSPGMLHNMPSIHQNIRVGGPSSGTPNNSTINQQFQLQQHLKQGFQFQSPTPTPHSNPSTMYNQQIAPAKPKQPNMMASPSHVSADFMQEAPPPNVVFNGSDSLRQAVAQRQQMPGYQKRGVMPSEQIIMMQSDGNPQPTATFFHQQGAGNNAHIGMKTHNNALYHNPNAQIHAAGPNNFNNSNNMEAHKIIGQDPMMLSALGHCSAAGSNITDATVTHFPMSSRPKIGLLDSGEISVLLKGTCNSYSYATRPTYPLAADAVSQKMPKLSKKSPGSATDGLSSSPGSSHSHTPSPAAMKRCLSTSNPPTPLHLDPMGSPTSMTLHHTAAKNSAPRHKTSCPVGTGHRPSLERQSSVPRSQISTATPSPITVNGPLILSRPASRTEVGQQYMTPPGTPGSSRSHYQNPPSYPQVPGSPSPFATNRDTVPSSATHAHLGTGDMVVLPLQSKYPAQSNENNSNRFGTGTPELIPSPWTNTVANHHPSSRQMNSSFGLSDPVESGSQNSAAIMSSSYNLHETSNMNQNPSKEGAQSNYLNNTLPYGVSPQSTEPTSSPCTPISDMVQGTLRSSNSPSFFNNQTDDLLSGNKPKKQPENSPAPTVPLQS